jgi:hypothetical protein
MKLLFNFIFIVLILSSCQNKSRGILKSSVNDSVKIISGHLDDKTSNTIKADTSWINKQQKSRDIFKLDIDSSFYVFVDEQAKPQKGDQSDFINDLVNKIDNDFPNSDKLFGKEIISFDVDWDGHLKNAKIVRSMGSKPMDQEIIKFLKSSPDWIPAKLKGRRVGQSFWYPLPIHDML